MYELWIRSQDAYKILGFHFQLTTFAVMIGTLQVLKSHATFAYDARLVRARAPFDSRVKKFRLPFCKSGDVCATRIK